MTACHLCGANPPNPMRTYRYKTNPRFCRSCGTPESAYLGVPATAADPYMNAIHGPKNIDAFETSEERENRIRQEMKIGV